MAGAAFLLRTGPGMQQGVLGQLQGRAGNGNRDTLAECLPSKEFQEPAAALCSAFASASRVTSAIAQSLDLISLNADQKLACAEAACWAYAIHLLGRPPCRQQHPGALHRSEKLQGLLQGWAGLCPGSSASTSSHGSQPSPPSLHACKTPCAQLHLSAWCDGEG